MLFMFSMSLRFVAIHLLDNVNVRLTYMTQNLIKAHWSKFDLNCLLPNTFYDTAVTFTTTLIECNMKLVTKVFYVSFSKVHSVVVNILSNIHNSCTNQQSCGIRMFIYTNNAYAFSLNLSYIKSPHVIFFTYHNASPCVQDHYMCTSSIACQMRTPTTS